MPLSRSSRPSVDILVRAYCGDKSQLLANLVATLAIFVNRREFRFVTVLDDESPADHELGDELTERGLADRVVYEPLPADWRNLFQGVAFPPPYNRWGYDRQQWSTFYMDVHSDRDVVGVVDSDSTFYSYLTRENIFSDGGQILISAYRPSKTSECYLVRRLVRSEDGCAYRNDKVALREDSPFEVMMTNRMPVWFWRSTYANFRRHIERQWGTSFDRAFEVFSREPYCAFNILANYALKHEPDRYTVRLLSTADGPVSSVAQNGCIEPTDIVAGGIRSYQLEATEPALKPFEQIHPELSQDAVHLNRLSHVACGVTVQTVRADRHYAVVHEELAALPPPQRDAMRRAFLEFVVSGLQHIKVVKPPIVHLGGRIEWELRFSLRRQPALRSIALGLVAKVLDVNRAVRRRLTRQAG